MVRILDLFLSGIAITFLSPLLILCILILKLTGEGEIFYFQQRIGLGEKKFKLMKFATMVKNSEKIGSGSITLKNDPRVLPFGKFLRKTKINELPQLFNILIGDMSVIGPRPLLEKQFYFYSKKDQKTIASLRPGLSGAGSIVFRDEESILSDMDKPHDFYKNNISPYKGYLETWYKDNYSVFNYLRLISITIYVVIFKVTSAEKLLSPDLLSWDEFRK